jgi:photosystem II stability/assembly factor-like uncharacterized protein
VLDADLVDQHAGWLLLSDCDASAAPTCHYSVERTDDGGVTWSEPALVGPPFASADGDAPRLIRFVNRADGFVYGHTSVFVTHDEGRTWTDAGLNGVEVAGMTTFENTVWLATRPCGKGVACAYEVRSSHDAGRSWTSAHPLPAGFSPDGVAAFGSGAILSSVPPGDIELSVDGGLTWRSVKSPCRPDRYRGDATTTDGATIWVLCQGYPAASGAIDDAAIFVSRDDGRTWFQRVVPGVVPSWLVVPGPEIALVDGSGPMVRTTNAGATWSGVPAGSGPFAFARFSSPYFGWAMDTARTAWLTDNGGGNWLEVTTLPSTQP